MRVSQLTLKTYAANELLAASAALAIMQSFRLDRFLELA